MAESTQNLTKKTFRADVKAFDESSQTVEYLVTSASLDRDEEICLPSGARFFAYEQNPIFLWGHDHSGPPERCLGKAISWRRVPEGWLFTFWLDIQSNPHAKMVFGLICSGCLRACSIGFIPIKTVTQWSKSAELAELPEEIRALVTGGICRTVYTEYEVIEVSAVHIGSNRDALVRAMGSDTMLSKSLSEYLRKEFGQEAVKVAAVEEVAPPQEVKPELKVVPDFVNTKSVGKYWGCQYSPKVADIAARLYAVASNLPPSVDCDGDGDIDDVSQVPDYVAILQAVIADMQSLKAVVAVEVTIDATGAVVSSETEMKGCKPKDKDEKFPGSDDEEDDEDVMGDGEDEDPEEEDKKPKSAPDAVEKSLLAALIAKF